MIIIIDIEDVKKIVAKIKAVSKDPESAHGLEDDLYVSTLKFIAKNSRDKKIAAMAEAASIGVAPHNPLGPIAGVAALHFAVSTPNHVIQEEMVGAVPWYFDVVQGPIRMIDGFWQIPEAPGLGIEVDEAACARHPFAQEIVHSTNAILEDGTIVDW